MKHVISLKKGAKTWEEGLPLGNGRLGATILGKINEEVITINEETIWYGPFRNRKNPDCLKNIDRIRQLLLAGEVQKAQFLAKMAMTSTPKYMNPYQPAGDMKIQFSGHLAKGTSNRACYLDLDDAVAFVKYDFEGASYVRTHFVSQKYNVFVTKLSCSQRGRLTVSANLNRKPFEENTEALDGCTVCNYGQCGPGGVHYFTGLRMAAKGGQVHTMGDFVYVEDADEVYLYVTAQTDFGGETDFREQCIARLDKAEAAGAEVIYQEHLRWYHSLNERVRLELNDCAQDERPTEVQLNELISGEREQNDYLTLLLFAFAKYLMISSSYGCRLPANLQGIWNGEYVPPWQSEFTININTEMNYWMAEKCNLPECHLPLFDLLDRLAENGKETAKELYGCRGFVAHHNTNIWANTDPEGIMDASPFWVMGGAWLSLHAYEHYLYTGDEEFLRTRALPVMREAIRFFEDYLYELPDGTLVTGPSVSPENSYISKIGIKGALCMGPTMDSMILRQLFTWYLEGCEMVRDNAGAGKQDEYSPLFADRADQEKIRRMLEKLPKTKTGSDGRVMEWQEEYAEPEPGHRHISHMYGLYPGNEITEDKPELFAGARKTIEARLSHGGGHTGWSRAWIACFFARLRDGEKVLENINGLLKKSIKINLYDTHPPFQIDGNFGIASAMIEALIQSHNGCIDLLPALPKAWRKGRLSGVRVRGAITCDLVWEDGKVTGCALTADSDKENVTVKCGGKTLQVNLPAGKKVDVIG